MSVLQRARPSAPALNELSDSKPRPIWTKRPLQGCTIRLFPGCVKLDEYVVFCLPTAQQESATFLPYIQATWEEPSSAALYLSAQFTPTFSAFQSFPDRGKDGEEFLRVSWTEERSKLNAKTIL